METLVLSDPVVVPEKTTDTYRITQLTLDMDAAMDPSGPGAVYITVLDNHGVRNSYSYVGSTAQQYIRFLNTANLTTKSLHKRILERLSSDGYLPGTVQGTPDPIIPAV